MNNIISYSKPIGTLKIIYLSLLSLTSIATLLKGDIGFCCFTFLIGLSFLSTEGSQIDLDSKMYRITKTILGIHFGKWKPCPKFDYVSVFSPRDVIVAPEKVTSKMILLNMFYETNKHQTFYRTTKKEDAIKAAGRFKFVFDIDILDATEAEKKWL